MEEEKICCYNPDIVHCFVQGLVRRPTCDILGIPIINPFHFSGWGAAVEALKHEVPL